MDFLIQNGIGWIVAIQSLGSWLELPMKFFSFWDYQHLFFIILPLIYWSVDAGIGFKIALILATSDYLNTIIKLLFVAPRPFWISTRVKRFSHTNLFGYSSGENSFGFPSGHTQEAAVLWGALAAWMNKRWAWIAALVLTFLIGFSRVYLGAHFVHDVLEACLIGYVILFMFLRFWDPLVALLKTKTLVQQVRIAFIISLILIAIGAWTAMRLGGYVFPAEWSVNAVRGEPLPDPDSIQSILSSAGSLFGLAAGAAWIASRGGYRSSGPIVKRFLFYVIGMLGILILWLGLGKAFPSGETVTASILRYIRFSLIGFWITAGAPWLFFHLKLADRPNTVVFPRTISEEVVLVLKDVPVEMDAAGKKLENPEG